MATNTRKKSTKKTSKKAGASRSPRKSGARVGKSGSKASKSPRSRVNGSAADKNLVIVESPTKAKTINKYLGPDFMVLASVGHVRDLPSRAPKGVKQEVPGVDLENDFAPTYEILPAKKKTVTELRRAAKEAREVWFATDLDREGEAIAWHLAQALGVPVEGAKRVVFNAITQQQIKEAFLHPRSIDSQKVNAQQARRILDRIVGYQVSPLLWKKVAGGLSAGRVQSVAVRLVVEREREIEAFIPDEYWKITTDFATSLEKSGALAKEWTRFLEPAKDGKPRTQKDQIAWLNEHGCMRAELVTLRGEPFKADSSESAVDAAKAVGFVTRSIDRVEDPKGRGPAKHRITVQGEHAAGLASDAYRIKSITTKRTRSRPGAPFITSSMQQVAANSMGFALQRTMRIAQQLYEGVDIRGGEGQTGLITYMRTDSTFVSPEAIGAARDFIDREYGDKYLPEKPNYYTTKVKAAQEAHEAIRPTNVALTPERVRHALSEEQYKLYRLIWNRFVSSQMVPAEWDSTTVLIGAYGTGGASPSTEVGIFKSTGRRLAFDGFYRATGVPNTGDEAILPDLSENQKLAPIKMDPTQHFTSPPPRYTEASLQKKLEEEGIGRPSTYAAIISTIQDRRYVDQVAPKDRRLRATDLGRVVTDKLVEAFPKIMDVAYTRHMESELDRVESDETDWVQMLHEFYGPFRTNLDRAHEEMVHAKAETEPAPHSCAKCGAATMYRFGRNGRFLSCATYPDCDYAAPIDSEGNPMEPEQTDVACPTCDSPMTRRTGRFGKFLGCMNYPECKGILNIDAKSGAVKLPKIAPFVTDLPCPKCDAPLNMRDSKRGFWLSCSKFPKCRGRLGWSTIDEAKQAEISKAWDRHVKDNPVPVVRTVSGEVLGEGYVPHVLGDESEEPVVA